MKVIIPLAEGVEEIEAITIIDVLRRADIDVVTATLTDLQVTGSHNIPIIADKKIEELKSNDFDAIVLPGGPGHKNLIKSEIVTKFVKEINQNDGYIAAICAAPTVLAAIGILDGKNATCYPADKERLTGANYVPLPFVVDGKIITGQAAGSAMSFSLKLVEVFKSKQEMLDLRSRLQVYWEEQEI